MNEKKVDWREINFAIMNFQIHVRKVTGGDDFGCVDATELKSAIKQTFSTSIAQAIAEERERLRENLPKIITPTVEPPPNNLSQNQIFASGQMNMLLRVTDLLSSLDPLTDKE